MQLSNLDDKSLRARVQFASVASSILSCFVSVKLAHRVSNH